MKPDDGGRALVIQRIGQDVFRDALMHYWGGRCPLAGITDPALSRASHIVPWADCTDEQRLDVYNGLLLSAVWDAAFDQGFVSFADDGAVLASPRLSEVARKTLGADAALPLRGSATRIEQISGYSRAPWIFGGVTSMRPPIHCREKRFPSPIFLSAKSGRA